MPVDVKDLVERSAARPLDPPDVDLIVRRARRSRRWRRSVAVCGSAAVVAGAFALGRDIFDARPAPPTPPVSSETTEGYVISNVEVRVMDKEGEKDTAVVTFDADWPGPDFPGVRDCSYLVYGSSGEIVGSKASPWFDSDPNGAGRAEVAVDGTPESAGVRCGERLDDPAGRYAVSNVEIVTEGPIGGGQELLVEYDVGWQGDTPTPAPAQCEMTVYEGDATLLTEDFSFYMEGADPRRVPYSTEVPQDFRGDPTAADIECRTLGTK